MVETEQINLSTQGDADIIDITSEVNDCIKKQKINNGIATISLVGSTGALTTIEYEPGLVKDLKEFFDSIIFRLSWGCLVLYL